ncbi:preQ0 transporter [Aestuariivirga litoralis]|uniref:PreQ0 transporter n=1 Tax=Aestuariivirga litoralis TaxID=2650924 RepID=A0A2W2AQF2_9HYPH|nr:VUT family protein [Aestuariivirga litoralis]PZF77615.1 preQ0 transporter [Aestuariivirga litoralis]
MWVALYVAAIVAVNWMFTAIAPWSTPMGDLYLANVVVGFIFVLRDYAQREVGHYILFATAAAGVLTWFMVDPAIAVASITAFILSETADWGVYSYLRRPLSQRILISSLIAVPLDTLAFQYLAGYLTPAAFATEILSKALGVMIVWYILRARDRKLAITAA